MLTDVETDLTLHELPPRTRTDRHPRWEVRYQGKLIGWVESQTIGRSSTRFFHGYVLIEGQRIDLEINTDLEERCQTVLDAWRDPASNVHARYALRLPEP